MSRKGSMSKLNLKIDSLVVRYGKVLKVSKIEEEVIQFKPFFSAQGDNDLTFTLKLDNVHDGHMRSLNSKDSIKTLLNSIIKKPIQEINLPKFDSKTALIGNQLEDTLWVIKNLWTEKKENSDTLPSGKQTILKKAILQAVNEIAAANNGLPDKAEAKLTSDLNSSLK